MGPFNAGRDRRFMQLWPSTANSRVTGFAHRKAG